MGEKDTESPSVESMAKATESAMTVSTEKDMVSPLMVFTEKDMVDLSTARELASMAFTAKVLVLLLARDPLDLADSRDLDWVLSVLAKAVSLVWARNNRFLTNG